VYFVFHGYEKDGVVFFAAMCYNPLSLPVNYCYNRWFGREAMALVAEKAPWITVLMCVAVVALSALGAWIGIRISKELKKSGVMKS
jgi:predicted Na+-dependent transporter